MIKGSDYIFGFATAFLMLMMLSASPAQPPDHATPQILEEQNKIISEQKDCIKKIQSKQKAIAEELNRIKTLLNKETD
jgi:hypothetical protein